MAFESLLPYLTLRQHAPAKVHPMHLLFSLNGREGDVYDEEAFQHFLSVERIRAQRSDRPLLLLLVGLRGSGANDRVPQSVLPGLFSGLGLCVREIDFVGWYREGRLAGAVLAQGVDLPDREAAHRIVARVTSTLGERLRPSVAKRLRVRIVRIGARPNA
jgi:hypothetical protein